MLVMSVNPGFAAEFLPRLDKIRRLHRPSGARPPPNPGGRGGPRGNIRSVVEAGVEIVVAGRRVRGGDPEAAVRLIEAAGA